MITNLTVEKDIKGKIKSQPSDYQPDERTSTRIRQIIHDFQTADSFRTKPYQEFNNYSLIDRMSLDQMSWNQFVDFPSQDPADAWRSRAFRPIVRNRIITIAAHITASIIYPKIYAQNENDQEDRDAAMVMRDLMEWTAEQSNYEETFVKTVLEALINPAAIIYTEFADIKRTVKEIKANGSWTEKQITDALFSGFQDAVVPCDELWIANFYEPDIQKQPYLIWRRVIDYETAKLKYGDNPLFEKYVRPGLQILFTDENRMFYSVYDRNLQERLVEEIIYYNRFSDLKLTLVNGVLMDDPDNPNPRKDKKYPFAKSGYEYISSRFFYYKSLPFKLFPDEEVVNTLYRMIIDGTYLQVMPPAIVLGDEDIGNAVVAPGVVTTLTSPNSSFQTIDPKGNLSAGYNALEKVESSINESSSDVLQSGQPTGGQQTAYEISRLEQNARVMLGLFGKMIGNLVKDFGYLRISDILQYMTVGEVMDIESPTGRLKFKTFVLPDKMVDGTQKTRRIELDMDTPEDEEGIFNESMDLYQREADLDNKTQIIKVNPAIFRNLKFKCMINPEAVLPRSEALERVLQLDAYNLLMQNPLTNKEAVTRDLALASFEKTKYDPDKYMLDTNQTAEQVNEGEPVAEGENSSLALDYLNQKELAQ